MIWFAWRQFRIQALIACTLLLALAIAFLVTGPHLVHTYNTTIVGCKARGDCNGSESSFLSALPLPTEPAHRKCASRGAYWHLLGRSGRRTRIRHGYLPIGLDAERVAHAVARREDRRRRTCEHHHGWSFSP
jgi:hypothetical protein